LPAETTKKTTTKPRKKDPAADPLKADFRNFLYAIWKHLGLPDPTPIQYDIALYLQHGPRREVIEAFRGVGKSWITTAFVLWLLYCDAQLKIMVVSANATKANEFSTFAKQLINEVPFLSHLKPNHDQRTSMLAFDVGPAKPDQSPSVKSVGITGQLTGSRADVIVADDIEVPHNSDTQGKRERILELIKEFDAVLKPNGRVVYLGTPQTEQTIYNTLPDRGYTIRIWPARFPGSDHRYGNRLAPYIVKALEAGATAGKTTDPARFSDEDLAERELSYGRSGFALQFQLDTSLSDLDKHPLKLADLVVYPLDPFRAPIDLVWASSPELVCNDLPNVGLVGDRLFRPAWVSEQFAPYEGVIMWVDPSGRGKDETSYAVVKLLHGRLFLTAAGGFVGGYDDKTLEAILRAAKKHHVPKILVEPNFGGGMFTMLLKSKAQNFMEVSIEDGDWSTVSKEQRIVDILEPVLNQHRLVVCPSVIESDYNSVVGVQGYPQERAAYYRLFYQLARMVRAKGALAQDDRLDALAGAVSYWTKHLARDTERAALDHKESIFMQELEKFMDGCTFLDEGAVPQRRMASTLGRRTQRR
jgi:hypothetical protein